MSNLKYCSTSIPPFQRWFVLLEIQIVVDDDDDGGGGGGDGKTRRNVKADFPNISRPDLKAKNSGVGSRRRLPGFTLLQKTLNLPPSALLFITSLGREAGPIESRALKWTWTLQSPRSCGQSFLIPLPVQV